MERGGLARSNQKFLDKFENKRSAVGKQGLLHLLQAKRNSLDQHTSPNSPDKPGIILRKQPRPNPPTPVASTKSQRNVPRKQPLNSLERHHKNVTTHTEEANDRYRREPKSQQLISNRIRLPSINKSSSQSMNLKSQRMGMGRREDSLALNSISKRMQLDHYALRHLQFMDKFEQQLLNPSSGKQTPRSDYF